MNSNKLAALVLGSAGALFALGGCAASTEATSEDDFTAIKYTLTETEASTSGFLLFANYKKAVRVKGSRPITASKVFSVIFLNEASGPNGLCPSCTATTPIAEQSDRRSRIHAENMSPLPMPDFLAGNVRFERASATSGEIHMGSITNGLSGTIKAVQLSPTEVEIVEEGLCTGAFPETFAGLHNRFFDLKSALERHLH